MEPLEEMPFEYGEYFVSDVIVDGPKERFDGYTIGWPSIAERYVQSKIAVHAHFRHDPGGDIGKSPSFDYCALFYRPAIATENGIGSNIGPLNAETRRGRSSERHNEMPVFVYVGQVAEDGQSMRRRGVRSVVRLQSLNVCLSCDGEVSQSSVALIWPCGNVVDDNKLNLADLIVSRHATEVRDCKGIGERVEGTSQAMNHVTNDQGEIKRDGVGPLNPCYIAGVFFIELGDSSVGLTVCKSLHGAIERVEVFARPC